MKQRVHAEKSQYYRPSHNPLNMSGVLEQIGPNAASPADRFNRDVTAMQAEDRARRDQRYNARLNGRASRVEDMEAKRSAARHPSYHDVSVCVCISVCLYISVFWFMPVSIFVSVVVWHSPQPTAHSSQPTAHSSQHTAHRPQPIAHSPQPTAHSEYTAHGTRQHQFFKGPLLRHPS
jgi:hypothetical protein